MIMVPKTWAARLLWIGVGLLLILSGIVTCIPQTSICSREPCWWLYLRGMWVFVNSPVVLGIGATLVTMYGYTVWRKQIPVREDHEAAKVILRASDSSQMAFDQLRVRGIRAWESAQGDSRVVFEKRFGRLVKALAELETAIDEGVVLWGRDYRDRIVPVRESLIELEFTLNGLLEHRDSPDRTLKERSVQAAQQFFGSGPQGDPIGDKLEAALKTIEDDARQRLIR